MEHTGATEIRIATADDEARFDAFVQGFLSSNGFPFMMLRSDPVLTGGGDLSLKRVTFEDDELSRRFRQQWTAQAPGPRAARGSA